MGSSVAYLTATPTPTLRLQDLTPLEEEEFLLQNALAVVLLALLGLSFGNILIKLLFVTYALFSAAVRYCIIAALVVVGLVIFI